jgi:calcineurin-like phosphoesterase family protein
MKTFVISDTHYGHANIIKFCNRSFASVEEMDVKMVEAWNSVVSPNDLVIHNGDFSFYKQDTGIFAQLKGRKILIRGNHDHTVNRNLGWETVKDYHEFNHNGRFVVMMHYPIESWNKKFHNSVHLYGHVHDTHMPKIANRHNICVEAIGYAPVEIEEFTTLFEETSVT